MSSKSGIHSASQPRVSIVKWADVLPNYFFISRDFKHLTFSSLADQVITIRKVVDTTAKIAIEGKRRVVRVLPKNLFGFSVNLNDS